MPRGRQGQTVSHLIRIILCKRTNAGCVHIRTAAILDYQYHSQSSLIHIYLNNCTFLENTNVGYAYKQFSLLIFKICQIIDVFLTYGFL
jgi:hypothetical protein